MFARRLIRELPALATSRATVEGVSHNNIRVDTSCSQREDLNLGAIRIAGSIWSFEIDEEKKCTPRGWPASHRPVLLFLVRSMRREKYEYMPTGFVCVVLDTKVDVDESAELRSYGEGTWESLLLLAAWPTLVRIASWRQPTHKTAAREPSSSSNIEDDRPKPVGQPDQPNSWLKLWRESCTERTR